MKARTTPELLPGTLYMLVLSTLSKGPLHGYAIAKRVNEASRDGLALEDESLYPALNRMLVKGWIKADRASLKIIARPGSTGSLRTAANN